MLVFNSFIKIQLWLHLHWVWCFVSRSGRGPALGPGHLYCILFLQDILFDNLGPTPITWWQRWVWTHAKRIVNTIDLNQECGILLTSHLRVSRINVITLECLASNHIAMLVLTSGPQQDAKLRLKPGDRSQQRTMTTTSNFTTMTMKTTTPTTPTSIAICAWSLSSEARAEGRGEKKKERLRHVYSQHMVVLSVQHYQLIIVMLVFNSFIKIQLWLRLHWVWCSVSRSGRGPALGPGHLYCILFLRDILFDNLGPTPITWWQR